MTPHPMTFVLRQGFREATPTTLAEKLGVHLNMENIFSTAF